MKQKAFEYRVKATVWLDIEADSIGQALVAAENELNIGICNTSQDEINDQLKNPLSGIIIGHSCGNFGIASSQKKQAQKVRA